MAFPRKSPTVVRAVLTLAVIVAALASCQQVFTYSPLSFLQTPMSSLTPDQQLSLGQSALSSTDPKVKQAAYNALKNTQTQQAQYLAGQLGVQLSGVSVQLLAGVASGSITLPTDPSSLATFIAQNNLNPSALESAAQNLQYAQTLGQTLNADDFLMGGVGLAMTAVTTTQPDGTIVVNPSPDPAAVQQAVSFVTSPQAQAAIAALPSTDPMAGLLQQIPTIVGGST